jgi:hypothetical protein
MSKTFSGVYEIFLRDPKQTAPRSIGYSYLQNSSEGQEFTYKGKTYTVISRSGISPGGFVVVKEIQPT